MKYFEIVFLNLLHTVQLCFKLDIINFKTSQLCSLLLIAIIQYNSYFRKRILPTHEPYLTTYFTLYQLMRALRHKYVHYEGFDFLRKNIFYLFLGLLCKDDILYDIQPI